MSTYELFWYIPGISLAALALFSWAVSLPYVRERRFTVRRMISASRQSIWDIHIFDHDNPRNAALHGNIVSERKVSHDPEFWEHDIRSKDPEKGIVTVRMEVLEQQAPEFQALRLHAVGETAYPLGARHRESIELKEHPLGTLVIMDFCCETKTLYHYINLRLSYWRYLRRLRRFAEADEVPKESPVDWLYWKSLAISVFIVGFLAILSSWAVALLVYAVMAAYEIGHWQATRMMGQTAPRMRLVPFLGGAAIPSQPHASRFNEALCLLIHPGLDVLLGLAFLIAALILAPLDFTNGSLGLQGGVEWPKSATVVALLATIVAGWNLALLAPIMQFRGGQILRSVLHSVDIHMARWFMLTLIGLVIAGAVFTGNLIIAIILSPGLFLAWHLAPDPWGPRPMGKLGAATICLGYCLALVIHASLAGAALWILGLSGMTFPTWL